MHGVTRIGLAGAIKSRGGTVSAAPDKESDCEADDKSGALWFSRIVRSLFTLKAGTALHFITGVDERTCHRYAAGHVRPPGYFIRTLLRSDQGWQFLAALMDGCDAPWWRDQQRARRIVDAIDNVNHD